VLILVKTNSQGGLTALMLSCADEGAQVECARLLIAAGVNKEAKNKVRCPSFSVESTRFRFQVCFVPFSDILIYLFIFSLNFSLLFRNENLLLRLIFRSASFDFQSHSPFLSLGHYLWIIPIDLFLHSISPIFYFFHLALDLLDNYLIYLVALN
jgi:hypothetical protein